MQFKEFVLNLIVRNRLKLVAPILLAIILSSFYTFHSLSMWQKASTLSNDGSTALGAFVEASAWLSENLRQNETALVPMRDVFYALSPQLRDKLVDYKSLWNSSGVVLKADTTEEEVLRVRNYFVIFLQGNLQVRYVVRDWVDPYARRLYEATAGDELMFLLREVETIPFTQSSGWGSQITIYERMQFTALFAMKFSSPPKQYFRIPSNTSVQFTSDGATIQKLGERVGFYLPLEGPIEASLQLNYLTMKIKPSVENLTLKIVFYYDANRDGNFSGYDIDYTKAAVFSQIKLGWVKDQWHYVTQAIPNSYDPVVQIAFIMNGDGNGTITLADLIVYTETTSEVVLADASDWLSENLKENEVALVPSATLFFFANQSLKGKLLDYRSLWDSSGLTLRANVTKDELLRVRGHLIEFLKENEHIRYVVRDWVYPYAERLYDATTGDELMLQLQQVQEIPFTVGRVWTRIITIYEKMQYTMLFAVNFTSPPKQYSTLPSNASEFDSNGVTIQKAGTRVGFYLSLEVGIDASKQNYLTMQFKLDVENVDLILGFYYDVDGDGQWSGYDIDNYVGVRFNQTQQGWVKAEWHQIVQTIPNAADPIVQIAVIADGGTSGTLTLANLVVYTR